VGLAAMSYYIHKALMALCNLPAEKVRVVQMETGGASAAKRYPSMIAVTPPAGDKVRKTGQDYYTDGSMAALPNGTLRAPPSHGLSKDGMILGGEIDFTIDGGAYATCLPWCFSRCIHAGGPYYWPNIRIRAKAVATMRRPWSV